MSAKQHEIKRKCLALILMTAFLMSLLPAAMLVTAEWYTEAMETTVLASLSAEDNNFGLRAYNSGRINVPGLGDNGIVRVRPTIDGVAAVVPYEGSNITAVLEDGSCAGRFIVNVNRIWNDPDNFNMIDLTFHAPWTVIYLSVTAHGQTATIRLVNPDPPTFLTLNPTAVTIDDDNLSATVTAGGTAAGSITSLTSEPALPAEVTLTEEDGVITVTGTRPAYYEQDVYGTFVVTVVRDGVSANFTINVNLTSPATLPVLTLDPTAVTIDDDNLSATVTAGGTAAGSITSLTSSPALPPEVTLTEEDGVITVTGTRPAFGGQPIIDTFIVTVVRDGVSADFTINVNLTPMSAPPVLTLDPTAVTIDDGNLSATVTAGGTAAGSITSLTSSPALPPEVTLTEEDGVITVTGVRPAFGNQPILDKFIVTVVRDGVSADFTINVNLTPMPEPPVLTVNPTAVTIDDDSLNATVTIGGTADGTIMLSSYPAILPPEVTVIEEDGVITVTGIRPAEGGQAVSGMFVVTVTRGYSNASFVVNFDLTPISSATQIARFHFDGKVVEVPIVAGLIDSSQVPVPAIRYGRPTVPGQVFMGWFMVESFYDMHYINNSNRVTALDLSVPLEIEDDIEVLNLYGSWLRYGNVRGRGDQYTMPNMTDHGMLHAFTLGIPTILGIPEPQQ